MITNIVIGGAIFIYAGWAFMRFINRSKKGKCAACSLSDNCSTNTCSPKEK
ncbi:hydrolase [Bacillus sp. FJAT-27225]|uniref:FeoB-associated Cys-rich membrane protein n=1 Tax=Bacillus sp. FJAT-27225 TaxID=1743144 RepID=UPI00080C351E|nr:FeoB-associated Cys-rich membrane protein [Bacillus sp. FJAT-27225]OCA84558.1 hydrolase [Bacillus sp. FJAT-27225]